jgi:hypothetical protein
VVKAQTATVAPAAVVQRQWPDVAGAVSGRELCVSGSNHKP